MYLKRQRKYWTLPDKWNILYNRSRYSDLDPGKERIKKINFCWPFYAFVRAWPDLHVIILAFSVANIKLRFF